MAQQRDNGVTVSALLRAGRKVSEVANHVGLSQLSTRSRSAWPMGTVSTDVQAVFEKMVMLSYFEGVLAHGRLHCYSIPRRKRL